LQVSFLLLSTAYVGLLAFSDYETREASPSPTQSHTPWHEHFASAILSEKSAAQAPTQFVRSELEKAPI